MITEFLFFILINVSIGSNNGEYRGEIGYSGGTELLTEYFTLYDVNGNELYTILKPRAIAFFISDSGTVFATGEEEIYCYDLSGNVRKLKELNYPNGFKFSPDNSLFFASDRDGIYAFSMSGELIYHLGPGRLFCSTEIGKKICVVSNDTLFYYEKGNLKAIKLLPTPFVRNLNFTRDKRGIILETPQGNEIIYLDDKER